MSKCLSASGFKWIDPKNFNSNKYSSNSSRGLFLVADLDCPEELREFHNDCPLAPDRTEIKKKMSSSY